MTQRDGLRVLKRARKYLAKHYCTAYGVGWGRWRSEAARVAYALLSGKVKELVKA